jgi:hypothetical protein
MNTNHTVQINYPNNNEAIIQNVMNEFQIN